MTIKIDLLPKYVGMRRKLKRFIVFCVSLVPVLGAFLFVKWYQGEQMLTKIETDLANIEPIAVQKENADKAKAAAETESAPYAATVDFIVEAGQTGPARAALIDIIRRWIYREALVGMIDISNGIDVNMILSVKNPDEYALFLGILRRASNENQGIVFAGLPLGSGVPGFGNPGATPPVQPVAGQAPAGPGAVPNPLQNFPTLPVTVTAKLLNPVVIPAEPVGPGGTTTAGPGGPGGPGGGGGPGGARP